MARSNKRAADDTEADASDDIMSSPPSAESNKRRRISDDDVSDEERGIRSSTPPSEVSEPEDGEDGEDDEEVAATQALRDKRAGQGGNEPAECGILLNVELFNFMCHEHIVYELGPLINFICGRNGSGKSAILTAIVICLGGKASSTNRGQSLKSFIKEGTDHSRIICRIKNEGEAAYMPDDYGNVIEIERFFARYGSSGYKLKNERGRIISTKKADLDDICDHFALQIDNPLNVLSQDMARQFISTSNASEKYKFFVKGVQLEQLDQDYRLIEDQLENIEANIDNKRPDIKELEQIAAKAKAKDDAMRQQDGLRQKMRQLRRQAAWVQVEAEEQLLAEYVREIEDADRRIEDAEAQITELDHGYQDSDAANNSAKERYAAAQAKLAQVKEEKREKKAQFDEHKRVLLDAQAEQRTIHQAIKDMSSGIQQKQQEIQQEQKHLEDIQGGGAAVRIRQLREAEENLQLARETYTAHLGCKESLSGEQTNAERALEEAVTTRTEATEDVRKQEGSLSDLIKNRNNHDTVFHQNMPNLLRLIRQEQRFRQPPVGPIGNHVRLLKPEWSGILEKSLGSSLSAFIVTSKHDSTILDQLMSRTRCFTPIFIGNDTDMDTSAHEPDQQFDTALRVLEIDHPLVRKQLVIAHGIEQSILVADLREATGLMYDQGRQKNVKRCFAMDSQDRRRGYMLSYSRDGAPSQDPIHEYAGRPRMKTDSEIQIQLRRERVEESKARLRASERTFYDAQGRLVRAKQALEKHARDERNFKLEQQTAQDQVESLREIVQSDNVENGRLDALQEMLTEAQDAKEVSEAAFKDAVISADTKKATMRAAGRELESMDSKLADLEREQAEFQKAAQSADKERTFRLRAKNEQIARVEEARKERSIMDTGRAERAKKVADFTAQASEICPRVNVPEGATHKSLTDQHNSIRADIERYSRQLGGTAEQIAAAAKRAHDAYKKALKDLRDLEALSSKLKGSLVERRERWKQFRSHISVRAKAQFTYLLSERSFRGRLITDHKQKLLELRVEPDITKKNGDGRGTRTLSGGEKSFSQICLLLSIWEAMGSPIRCLDEFDVYMDAVNRSLSVNLLVEAARQSIGRQFVLISPGTKNDIQRASDIKAQEIAAPERGQRTLVFGQA